MINDLVSPKHPILTTKSSLVVEDNWDEAISISNKLVEIMEKNSGIQGVSSNQIGECLSVVVCRFGDDIQTFVNPEIVWSFGKKKSLEGCISFKGRYFVKRPLFCKVSWLTLEKQKNTKIFLYKKARVICHEIDHVNGKCINNIGVYWKYSEQAEQIDLKRKEKKCQKS